MWGGPGKKGGFKNSKVWWVNLKTWENGGKTLKRGGGWENTVPWGG